MSSETAAIEKVLWTYLDGLHEGDADKIALLLSFDPAAHTLDVPDPYYAGPGMFDEVLGMIESASRALFRQLEPAIRPAI